MNSYRKRNSDFQAMLYFLRLPYTSMSSTTSIHQGEDLFCQAVFRACVCVCVRLCGGARQFGYIPSSKQGGSKAKEKSKFGRCGE